MLDARNRIEDGCVLCVISGIHSYHSSSSYDLVDWKKNGRKTRQSVRRRICLKRAEMFLKEWPKYCQLNCWNEKAIDLQKNTPTPRQTYQSRHEQSYRQSDAET